MTALERALWHRLRREQTGFKFRRQYPAGSYILDFYCPEVKVGVEIDGPVHESRQAQDVHRDKWLAARGVTTLRFSSELVYEDIEIALAAITQECEKIREVGS